MAEPQGASPPGGENSGSGGDTGGGNGGNGGPGGSGNPLDGTSYTSKVQGQMAQGPGEFHSFPDLVDNYGGDGKMTIIFGNDGVARTLLRIPGAYNGLDGNFEYIIEPDGITVNHRFFRP